MKKFRAALSLLLVFVLTYSVSVSSGAVFAAQEDTAMYFDHEYKRFDVAMTWTDAKAYCEELGGYLATITSSGEQEVVKSLISTGQKDMYWLGGTDEAVEGRWKWVTGEKWSYWSETVSFDNAWGCENYLQMQRHHWGDEKGLGLWNDANNENHINGEESFFSTEHTGFVCEFGDSELPSEDNSVMPIIYIIGRTGIYTADGKPTIKEDPSFITDSVMDCAPQLMNAVLFNKWDEYCDAICGKISSEYNTYVLNSDGEVDNGTHILWSWNGETMPDRQGDIYTYKFEYDARIDPCAVADDLHEYIEKVKELTGYSRFNLISRCLGCNIACAYLEKYGWEDINTNVMFASAAKGYDFVGQLFSGKLKFDSDSISYYCDENLSLQILDGKNNDVITEVVKASVALAKEMGLLEAPTFAGEQIYLKIYEKIVPRLIIATYGTCPGYWAMVNDANYEDAKQLVFGREAATKYKKLVEKIDNYHYNVQNNIEKMLLKMKQDGVKVNVICKYGFQTPPFIEGSKKLSDNRIEVSAQSFGATTANNGEMLSRNYIDKVKSQGKGKYISPDETIDSSTALFPDYTWYVKNIDHNPFYDCFNPLMLSMCDSKEQMTVFDKSEYPQYLFYSDGKVEPLTGNNMDTQHYTQSFFEALLRWYKSIFNLIKSFIVYNIFRR